MEDVHMAGFPVGSLFVSPFGDQLYCNVDGIETQDATGRPMKLVAWNTGLPVTSSTLLPQVARMQRTVAALHNNMLRHRRIGDQYRLREDEVEVFALSADTPILRDIQGTPLTVRHEFTMF